MSSHPHHAAVDFAPSTVSNDQGRNLRRRWTVITSLLVVALFLEAVFAGAMLSGASWARAAHGLTAVIVIGSTVTASLVALLTLRRIPHGPKLGFTLLLLAAVAILQAAVGAASAKGAILLWVHVPLGVALVGFAALAAASARRLP
jgi:hypothetical protein